MKKIYLIVFTVFFFGCIKPKTNFYLQENNNTKFKLCYSKKDNINIFLDSLILINNKNRNQTLNLIPFDILISKSNLKDILTCNKDFNFDGFNDLEIYRPDLSGYNSFSNHFLFNKKNKKYENNSSLDSINNIEILEENKELCSKWHAGLSVFYLTKYNWQKDKLNIVYSFEESNSADGKIYLTIIRKNKVISKDSIIDKSIVYLMKCN